MDLSKILNKDQRKSIMDALLTPFSWVYGAGVWLRNTAFNIGLLPQEEFDVPVVSVGNITVGGTGKTPHVEYIIEALYRRYHVAVLSRGYKRKTKGFILASNNMTPRDIGDEPYQIYRKYSGLITLAVCEKRRKGIRELLRIDPNINLILLDDGFQHRYVIPKVNIVLVDYNRPPYEDRLMPLGTLREPSERLLRCDMVVVTKCPTDLTAMDIRMMKKNLDPICRSRSGLPYPISATHIAAMAARRRCRAVSDRHSDPQAAGALPAPVLDTRQGDALRRPPLFYPSRLWRHLQGLQSTGRPSQVYHNH